MLEALALVLYIIDRLFGLLYFNDNVLFGFVWCTRPDLSESIDLQISEWWHESGCYHIPASIELAIESAVVSSYLECILFNMACYRQTPDLALLNYLEHLQCYCRLFSMKINLPNLC